MSHCVVGVVYADVSKHRNASIFKGLVNPSGVNLKDESITFLANVRDYSANGTGSRHVIPESSSSSA